MMKKIARIFLWLVRAFVNLWKKLAFFFGSLFLAGVVGLVLIAVLVSRSASDTYPRDLSQTIIYQGGESQIAVIRLYGDILSSIDESFLNYNPFAISPQQIRRLTSQLSKLDYVEAVVLEINSAGGSVAASEEIYQIIKSLNQEKPVFAYFTEMAASGGYYIALPARKIYSSIPSITGSIGVIAYKPDVSELMEKVGVKLDTFQSGDLKDFGSPARTHTPEEQEVYQSIVADSYDLFIERLMQQRNFSKTQAVKLADGRIYSGKQASANGLIDGTGSFDEMLLLVSEEVGIEDPTVAVYSLSGGFFSGWLNSSLRGMLSLQSVAGQMPSNKTKVYFY